MEGEVECISFDEVFLTLGLGPQVKIDSLGVQAKAPEVRNQASVPAADVEQTLFFENRRKITRARKK